MERFRFIGSLLPKWGFSGNITIAFPFRMHSSLVACLHAPTNAPKVTCLSHWWETWERLAPATSDPAARAIGGGFLADRVAWAFASGYQAALRALVPGLPWDTMAAFCVTEVGGGRPQDIRTTIRPQRDGMVLIDGAKRWTMLGNDRGTLLVVGAIPTNASTDAPSPLRVAQVPVPSPGLAITPISSMPFIPELPHATIAMSSLQLPMEALLPGDGYTGYIKPFRTHEDIQVRLAVLAYLLREARSRRWPQTFVETLVAAIALFAQLATQDVAAPETHVVLAGALQLGEQICEDAGPLWAMGGDTEAASRWNRDAALFQLNHGARQRRAARAWEKLGSGVR